MVIIWERTCFESILLEYTLPFNSSKTRNTCIVETREARERKTHKMSGMEGGGGGGENWSKLCSLGGRVSTLAL